MVADSLISPEPKKVASTPTRSDNKTELEIALPSVEFFTMTNRVRRLVSSTKEQVVTFRADHSRCDQIIERLQTEQNAAKWYLTAQGIMM